MYVYVCMCKESDNKHYYTFIAGIAYNIYEKNGYVSTYLRGL